MTDFPLPHSRKICCDVCESVVYFEHHEETKECPVCWSPVKGPPYSLWVKCDAKDYYGDMYVGDFPTYEKADKAGKEKIEEDWNYWSYFVVAYDGTHVG